MTEDPPRTTGHLDWTSRLEPGEQMLWAGSAGSSRRVDWRRLIDVHMIGYAVIYAGIFLVMSIGSASLTTIAGFLGLVLAIIVLPELLQVIWQAWTRPGTAYAVTDRRALAHCRPDTLRVCPLHASTVLLVRPGAVSSIVIDANKVWGHQFATVGSMIFECLDEAETRAAATALGRAISAASPAEATR